MLLLTPRLHSAHPEGHEGGGVALRSATVEPRVSAEIVWRGGREEGERREEEGTAEGEKRDGPSGRGNVYATARRRQAGAEQASTTRAHHGRRARGRAREPHSLCGGQTEGSTQGEGSSTCDRGASFSPEANRFGGESEGSCVRCASFLRQKRQRARSVLRLGHVGHCVGHDRSL